MQCRQALNPCADWPRPVVDSVLHGGDGFCLLDPMRSYSAETAALLAVLQSLVASSGVETFPANDVVHFDFQGANILVDRGEITGVIDWEGCCAGDATFDLATLYFYTDPDGEAARHQRDRLWDLLMARIPPSLLGAYLAHLVLRQLDWSIRFHERAMIAHWLRRGNEVLHRFTIATGR
jgi:thiamine kinase-like enzyme